MKRSDALARLLQLAESMVQGSISETTRTCGRPGCRCHRGERHGPHTYITFRAADGRSAALYVPEAVRDGVREATDAWREFWDVAGTLAAENRAKLLAPKKRVGRPRRERHAR